MNERIICNNIREKVYSDKDILMSFWEREHMEVIDNLLKREQSWKNTEEKSEVRVEAISSVTKLSLGIQRIDLINSVSGWKAVCRKSSQIALSLHT